MMREEWEVSRDTKASFSTISRLMGVPEGTSWASWLSFPARMPMDSFSMSS